MAKNSNAGWKPPDRLGYSSVREVRLTAQGIALSVIAACLIVGAFALGIFLARTVKRETLEQRLLVDQGVAVEATVARLWRTGDKSNEPRVTYRFRYQDSVYTNSVKAPLSKWRELKVGQTMAVRFVPGRPTISHPADWENRGLPLWFPYVITAFLAGMGAMIGVQVARQMRLLAEGRPAPGRITGSRKGKKLVVLYEFQIPDGKTIKGRSSVSRMPPEGEPVCVLYDAENPRRNALYPMQMVRLG